MTSREINREISSPCKKCGGTERYKNRHCKACQQMRNLARKRRQRTERIAARIIKWKIACSLMNQESW